MALQRPNAYEYQVIEDKDGGIHLFVFDSNDELIVARTGYEYGKKDLPEAMELLNSGADPRTWEGSWDAEKMGMTEKEFYATFTPRRHEKGEWWTVATERCIYAKKLSLGARICFLPVDRK